MERNGRALRPVHQLAFGARRRIIEAHSAASLLRGVSARGQDALRHSKKSRHAVARVAALVLLVATLAAQAVVATTFMSVEPIPGGDAVGEPTLAVIQSAGDQNLERWSNRLLNDCGFVRRTIDALTADGAIRTVNGPQHGCRRRRRGVRGDAATPFVFTIRDSGFTPSARRMSMCSTTPWATS